MATIDELHAQSVNADLSGLKQALIKALRTGAEFVSPPADGPGAAAVAGIRSLLPGRGNFSQEFDRYNRAAAPSPLYSGPEKFGSVVKEPGALGPSQGESAQAQAMAMQTALIAAMRRIDRKQFDKQGTMRADAVKQSDPGYLYHATNVERANEIAQSRMKLHEPWEFTDQGAWPDGGVKPRAYFNPRAENVAAFAPEEGPSVVLRTPEGKRFKRESGTGDVFTRKPVSARDLEIATPEGWKALATTEAVTPSPEAAAAKVLREVGVGSRPGKVVMEVPLEEAFKFRFNDILDPATGEPHPLPHVSRGVSGKQRWDSLRSSVEQSGINTPIEVGLWSADEGLVPKVLDGNHRLAVAKDLGLPSIQVDLDRDVAKKIGWLK